MFIRVRGIFGVNFCGKKAPRSSRLVWGCLEPRLIWIENGVSLHVPSRSEGMETKLLFIFFIKLFESTCAFPFGGNGNEDEMIQSVAERKESTCAFPFGGNGNNVYQTFFDLC